MPRDEAITSRENKWFKRLKKALDKHDDEIVIEGPKHVADAISAGWTPIAIVARQAASLPAGIETTVVFAEPLFNVLSKTTTSQGILGLFRRLTTELSDAAARVDGPLVVLDGIQDPGNVGTIVRLAAAFDAAAVVCTEGTADPFSQKSIRASAGCALAVPIVQCTRRELLEAAAGAHRPIFVARAGTGGSDEHLPDSAVIVFGSEGQGASPEIERAGVGFSVPMSPRVESLNVAAAAAIILAGNYRSRSRGKAARR